MAASVALTSCSAGTAADSNSTDESAAVACRDNPIALQVLGSGGPIADDHRAGASNIVWVDGKAKLLIDAAIAGHYSSPILLADDLSCHPV